MTNEQRQKIITLRYQGFGYKEISKATGLSRDTIRGYCKRNGLHGYAAELATEYKKIMKEEFLFTLCLNCGKNSSRIAWDVRENTAQRTAKQSGKKLTENHILLIASIAVRNLKL